MRIYPAIRAQMGDWRYYIVRMKMREIANEVQLAHDIYEDKTLSDAVQRALGEKRVRNEITGYLSRRPDRFFSSIVVAALEGEPAWHPIEMDRDVVPDIFARSSSLKDSFGVLSFGDDPKYYALDGQHRVAAIKLLVNGEADVSAPEGFDSDLLSVLVVLREDHDVSEGVWMRRYRRLFSSLNRYAKPTDRDTNIIMDEDDLVAIVTRRLISDHEFFRAPGRERDSFKVLTKGKNLKEGVSHFTTLQTLYEINQILLTTRERQNRGWTHDQNSTKLNKQIRPDEDDLEKYYEEVVDYWDAILDALPVLRRPPREMRVHDAVPGNDGSHEDHVLFWPIGQELFAKFARSVLDDAFPEGGRAAVSDMAAKLALCGQIPWDLHSSPWRYLLLVPKTETEDSWRMRSEDRKAAVEVAFRLLCWISGKLDEADELRTRWRDLLYPEPSSEEHIEAMWREIESARARIVTAGAE